MLSMSRNAALFESLKQSVDIPVISFPGDASQVVPTADALLFLSMVSGRNPELLIGQHVRAAPLLKEYGMEAIPTGYMLIESGTLTSVEYMSSTRPIPRGKKDIAVAHALAAQYLGMKLIYMDSGSGAGESVPGQLISGSGRRHHPSRDRRRRYPGPGDGAGKSRFRSELRGDRDRSGSRSLPASRAERRRAFQGLGRMECWGARPW